MRAILVEKLGEETLESLSGRVGGTRLRVPSALVNHRPPERFLKRVGDRRLAVVLILHFGDSEIYVPRLARGCGPERVTVRKVMNLTNKGLSAREIALRLRCCERVVYRKRRIYRESLTGKDRP